METDIRYSEPSSRAFERETATSAEQWSNWTTNQIRSAIEAERERTFDLLAELLARIQRDMIPEVVATLPALRGPAGPVGPAGKLPIAKEWTRETVFYEGPSSPTMAPLIRPFTTPASRLTMRRTGFVSPLLVAMLSLSATAAPSKMMPSMPPMTSSRSTAGSFLALHDKPGPCPGPGWQLLLRAGQTRRRRRKRTAGSGPPALLARREKTRRRLSAGR